ncbi:MAG: type II toxin-antitoxin system RatA family toxin [Rhodovibrionaceae bacterium]
MPTHAEERIVPFQPQQMYDLVADVDSYPDFLPWCVGARVRERGERLIVADLMIGYKMIRERFTSRVTLQPEDRRIDVRYIEGPFKYLENHWIFKQHPEGCLIDFYVDFEFKSRFLQRVVQPFFNEAVKRMVRAFETRAGQLYG